MAMFSEVSITFRAHDYCATKEKLWSDYFRDVSYQLAEVPEVILLLV